MKNVKTFPAANGTAAVHAGTPETRPDHTLTPAIAQTATYTFRDTADLERYFAGRDDDPDRQEYGATATPRCWRWSAAWPRSTAPGRAALRQRHGGRHHLGAALVKGGDHVVLFRDGYRRTRQFVVGTLARLGVTHTLGEPASLDALERAIGPKTRVAITEFPSNPYLRCVDLERFAAVCRAGRVKSIVDATFATPLNARPRLPRRRPGDPQRHQVPGRAQRRARRDRLRERRPGLADPRAAGRARAASPTPTPRR